MHKSKNDCDMIGCPICAEDKIFEAGFDHPCRETCSGWKQGYERGQKDLEFRVRNLTAYPSAMCYAEHLEKINNELIEALKFYAYGANNWDIPRNIAREALAKIGVEK